MWYIPDGLYNASVRQCNNHLTAAMGSRSAKRCRSPRISSDRHVEPHGFGSPPLNVVLDQVVSEEPLAGDLEQAPPDAKPQGVDDPAGSSDHLERGLLERDLDPDGGEKSRRRLCEIGPFDARNEIRPQMNVLDNDRPAVEPSSSPHDEGHSELRFMSRRDRSEDFGRQVSAHLGGQVRQRRCACEHVVEASG